MVALIGKAQTNEKAEIKRTFKKQEQKEKQKRQENALQIKSRNKMKIC